MFSKAKPKLKCNMSNMIDVQVLSGQKEKESPCFLDNKLITSHYENSHR